MNVVYQLQDKGHERNVSYLPLSHIAASMMDMYVMMACQGSTYFADKSALKGTLTMTLQEATPTLFLGKLKLLDYRQILKRKTYYMSYGIDNEDF